MEERTIIQSGDGSKKDRLKKGEEFSVDESRAWYRRYREEKAASFLLVFRSTHPPRYTMFKQDNQSR